MTIEGHGHPATAWRFPAMLAAILRRSPRPAPAARADRAQWPFGPSSAGHRHRPAADLGPGQAGNRLERPAGFGLAAFTSTPPALTLSGPYSTHVDASAADKQHRASRQKRQQPCHHSRRNGDAALRRRKTRPREVQKDRAAAAAPARPDVPVHHDAGVVEIVGSQHAFVAGRVGDPDRAVVVAVVRHLAPAEVRRDRQQRQSRSMLEAASAQIAAEQAHRSQRRRAVALALAG